MKKILAVIVLVFALSGCLSVKNKSQLFSGEYSLGSLPDDICILNGRPQILGVSTESDGGYNVVYIRNNGDVVIQEYLADWLTNITEKKGKIYFKGDACK